MVDDNTLTLQDTIRSVIQEEFSQGLGDLKERVQESFRQIVQESFRQILLIELPRAGLCSRPTDEKSLHEPPPSDSDVVQQVVTPQRSADAQSMASPLCQTTDNSPGLNLPGIVADVELQNTTRERTSIMSQKRDLAIVPVVSETDSAPLKRIEEVCVCGNVFEIDSCFCQECGRMRAKTVKWSHTGTSNMCGRERLSKAELSRTEVPRNTKMSCVLSDRDMTKPTAKQRMTYHRDGQGLFKKSEERSTLPSKLQRFTTSKYYEALSFTLILTNAIYLGWETQYLAERARDFVDRNESVPDPPGGLRAFHASFCIAFALELGLRWRADGFINFFQTKERTWNVLDVIIVGTSIWELLLDIVRPSKRGAMRSVSVVRMLRILRVVRMARIIRVMKFFRELRMMIYSIFGCLKNLIWALIVLLMTFYIFGIGFTSAVTDYLDSSHKCDASKRAHLIAHFGTVDKSLLTLFMSMSGGNDWGIYYEALKCVGKPYTGAFLLYVVFTMFAIVNIVTGIFVESALQSNTKDREVVVTEEMEEIKKYLKAIAQIFHEMDEDGDGRITLQEFDDKLSDKRVIAYFRSLKLDVSDAQTLFSLIDFDQSGEISIDEFLDGCYMLQGESRALDMKLMQHEVRFLHIKFQEMQDAIEIIQRRAKSITKALNAKASGSRDESADVPTFIDSTTQFLS